MPDPTGHRPRALLPLLGLLIQTKLAGSEISSFVDSGRRRRAAAWLGGLALGLGGPWLVANLVPYQPPEPLWTALEGPAPIDSALNGWSPRTLEGLKLDIPAPVEDALAAGAIDDRRDAVDEFLARPDAREASEWIEGARHRPQFVARCELGETCPVLTWIAVHKVGLVRVLALAEAGEPAEVAEAYALLADLVRMDAAALETTNTVLAKIASLANLQRDLQVAEALVEAHGAGLPRSPIQAAFTRLSVELESLELGSLDLRAVVVNDYLFVADMLETDEAELLRGPRWLYSRALTQGQINEGFEARYAAAARGDTFGALGGGAPSPTDAFGWWLVNPVGDRMVEALRFDPGKLAASMDSRLAELSGSRARLIDQMRDASELAASVPVDPPGRPRCSGRIRR